MTLTSLYFLSQLYSICRKRVSKNYLRYFHRLIQFGKGNKKTKNHQLVEVGVKITCSQGEFALHSEGKSVKEMQRCIDMRITCTMGNR